MTDAVERLSLTLWSERELLDTLLYRLEVEQLVLASGRTAWLMRSAREVEATLQSLRETEVLRAMAADEAARAIGYPANPSLKALAEAADEPWRTILLDHREAFVSVSRRIAEMAEANRDLITSGYRSARETLMSLDDSIHSYNPEGVGVAVTMPPARLFDRSL